MQCVKSLELEAIDFYRIGCKMHTYTHHTASHVCGAQRIRECTSNEYETKCLASAAAAAG